MSAQRLTNDRHLEVSNETALSGQKSSECGMWLKSGKDSRVAEATDSFLRTPAMELVARHAGMAAGAPAGCTSGLEEEACDYPMPAAIGRYRVVRPLGEGVWASSTNEL